VLPGEAQNQSRCRPVVLPQPGPEGSGGSEQDRRRSGMWNRNPLTINNLCVMFHSLKHGTGSNEGPPDLIRLVPRNRRSGPPERLDLPRSWPGADGDATRADW
jgi:hypothetical protein